MIDCVALRVVIRTSSTVWRNDLFIFMRTSILCFFAVGDAYIASNNGGFYYEASSNAVHLLQTDPAAAVAYYAPKATAAFGGNDTVTLYVSNVLVRRDWVTDVVNGQVS